MYISAGSLTILLVLISSMSPSTCSELGGPVFYELPRNVTCFDGDIVTFNCSVHRGDILWFVNKTFVLRLPTKFNASFKTTSRNAGSDVNMPGGEKSILQFIAKPQANNSQIQCAVGVDNKLEKAVAFLIVYDARFTVNKPEGLHAQNGSGAIQSNLSWLLGAVALITFTLQNGL